MWCRWIFREEKERRRKEMIDAKLFVLSVKELEKIKLSYETFRLNLVGGVLNEKDAVRYERVVKVLESKKGR